MTKKDFILKVTEDLKNSPSTVLKGHGIRPDVLKKISERDDIIAKLANILWTTIYAKKGALGLRKTDKFTIKGYRNFNDFNAKGREDVSDFKEGLMDDDSLKFTEEDSVITILALLSDEPSETTEEQIVNGQSVYLPFSKAVRSEFKSSVSFYIVVMLADSAIRKPAVKQAPAKQITPADIKRKLTLKANKKLKKLRSANQELLGMKGSLQNRINQMNYIKKELGTDDIDAAIISSKKSKQEYDTALKNALRKVGDGDRKLAKMYLEFADTDKSLGKKLLSRINSTELKQLLTAQAIVTAYDRFAPKRKMLRQKIAQYSQKNEQLMISLAEATDSKTKNYIRWQIKQINAKISQLRDQLGTYRNMSNDAFSKKTAAYEEVVKALENNIKKGLDIKESLDAAIAKIDATNAEKELLKQQVMVQVANGDSVQQAIQTAMEPNAQIFDADDLINRL